MSKEYSVGGDGITLNNQGTTLIFLNPAAAPNVSISLMRIWASQSGTATSAMQRVQVETQASAFPSGLSSATPRQLKTGDTVASIITGGTTGAAGTVGIANATNIENGGTKTVRFGDNFNNLNGYLWVPTPRELINLVAGFTSGLGLFLPAAPGSLTNWAFGYNFSED